MIVFCLRWASGAVPLAKHDTESGHLPVLATVALVLLRRGRPNSGPNSIDSRFNPIIVRS